MRFNKHIVAAGLIAAAFSMPAFATSMNNGLKGKKNIELSDKVSKNQIKFISTAPAEEIRGTADVAGAYMLDLDNLEATTGQIKVEVKSMKTGNGTRDEHMYSDVWLDAEKHPNITFTVKKINGVKVNSAEGGKTVAQGTAIGDFTLHGVTKEISAPITITYIKESEETKKRASGDLVMVKADMKVSLADFNIAGKKGLVGNKVGQVIDIEANLFGSTK